MPHAAAYTSAVRHNNKALGPDWRHPPLPLATENLRQRVRGLFKERVRDNMARYHRGPGGILVRDIRLAERLGVDISAISTVTEDELPGLHRDSEHKLLLPTEDTDEQLTRRLHDFVHSQGPAIAWTDDTLQFDESAVPRAVSTSSNFEDFSRSHAASPDMVHQIHKVDGVVAEVAHHHISNVRVTHRVENIGKAGMLEDVFQLIKAAIRARKLGRNSAPFVVLLHLAYPLNYESVSYYTRTSMTLEQKAKHIKTRDSLHDFLYNGNGSWLQKAIKGTGVAVADLVGLDGRSEADAMKVVAQVLPPHDLLGYIKRMQPCVRAPEGGFRARMRLVREKMPQWRPVLEKL